MPWPCGRTPAGLRGRMPNPPWGMPEGWLLRWDSFFPTSSPKSSLVVEHSPCHPSWRGNEATPGPWSCRWTLELPSTGRPPTAPSAWAMREDFAVPQGIFGVLFFHGQPASPSAGPHGTGSMFNLSVFLLHSPRSANIKPERNNYQKELKNIPCYPTRFFLALL